MLEILVLYYSRNGSIKEMAKFVARGVNSVEGVEAVIRTVPEVSTKTEATELTIPSQGDMYAKLSDLRKCNGLILGSPTRFGNMAAALKYFLESASPLWLDGSLENKPASVFTASSSIHGGNETTLLSMHLPLLHLGMLIMGVPYSVPSLSKTLSGGTPYGASHVSGDNHQNEMTDDEKKICFAQGERMALLVKKLGDS
jgi:NAD(P)H dehydrogenase (quinone)|tara:strand:+ start:1817 stop:2413 length:597 start_codon:yes stop_codon:yes gene_type:complete